MLNYNEFKKAVVERIREFLPEELKAVELTEVENNSLNRGEGEALVLKRKGNVSPSGYFKSMYSIYEENVNLEETLQIIAQLYVTAIEHAPKKDDLDFAKAKDNIVFRLMNTEMSKNNLSAIPHRTFLDLSIGYTWLVDCRKDDIGTILINNSLATKLELTEQELYDLAKENTVKLMQPGFESMSSILLGLATEAGDQEMIDEMANCDNGMWILSNKRKILGASTMLYEEKLQELANKLDSNFYILPSSIGEVIAVPENDHCPTVENLKEMVKEVNANEVELNEQLSNNVYYYCRESNTVSIAGGK